MHPCRADCLKSNLHTLVSHCNTKCCGTDAAMVRQAKKAWSPTLSGTQIKDALRQKLVDHPVKHQKSLQGRSQRSNSSLNFLTVVLVVGVWVYSKHIFLFLHLFYCSSLISAFTDIAFVEEKKTWCVVLKLVACSSKVILASYCFFYFFCK